jgi:hypothetical protein
MLTLSQVIHLKVFIDVLTFKLRTGTLRTDNIWQIRNVYFEYKLREQYGPKIPPFRYNHSLLFWIDKITITRLSLNLPHMIEQLEERYSYREQPLGLYSDIELADLPDLRLPKPGITALPIRYHQKSPGLGYIEGKETLLTNEPHAAEEPLDRKPETYSVDIDLSGQPADPEIINIISQWTPHFLHFLNDYCRPPSYGPQAFYDFNRTAEPHPPPSAQRESDILELIDDILNIKPFQPIHFADTLASGIPLNTSASFSVKKLPLFRTLSQFSAPSIFKDRPLSKGYSINTTLAFGRHIVHNVKNFGTPNGDTLNDALIEDSAEQHKLKTFFQSEPTELFIRSQISKRDPTQPKKIRPVYAVALLFILIEIMLTYPLLAQLRNPECAIMHGLETFRGSMQLIDQVAIWFTSYVSLDWSQFDQRLPFYVVIAYFLKFLPRLIIVNKGYAATHTYPDSRLRTIDAFAVKIFNLLQFLLIWYINMVFISYDGYAYVRHLSGVPSGLLNTQALDSFGNLYIILDCMLQFGFTKTEIRNMIFFIMGDDNIFFAQENFLRICDFMAFLKDYAEQRHGMILSVLKSVWTTLRNKIEVLGYTNTYGMPTRPIGKLVAQLAYPERPVDPKKLWIHAARALGLAVAACGQDSSFHLLCYFVYKKYKPSEPIETRQFLRQINYVLKESFDFKEDEQFISFPEFPSLVTVRQMVSGYQGFFTETDKWKTTIFTNPPSEPKTPEVYTLADWLNDHPDYTFVFPNIM